MNKKTIMVDIDGVISAFHQHFIQYLNHATVPSSNYKAMDLDGWKMKGMTEKEIRYIHEQYASDGMYLHLPLKLGAYDDLRSLHKKRNILLCTGRDATLVRDTKVWLRNNDLDTYPLMFEKDKVDVCQGKGIEELIDDSIDILIKAKDAGIKTYAVYGPNNYRTIDQHIPPITLLNKIGDIHNYI